jgi:hypothetical protein
MTKPMIRIHNAETQEVIDREMNEAEFAQYEANQADQIARAEAKAEAEAAKAHERSALLTKLGITEDEAKLLLS